MNMIVWDKVNFVKYWINNEWEVIKENDVVSNLFYSVDRENKLIYIKYETEKQLKTVLATYDYYQIMKVTDK